MSFRFNYLHASFQKGIITHSDYSVQINALVLSMLNTLAILATHVKLDKSVKLEARKLNQLDENIKEDTNNF